MTFHVLVPDSVNKKAVEILEQAGLKVTAPGQMKREETLAAIADADALIIRSATKADAALINASTKLKAIARAGVGVDNVDLDAASAKKITLGFTASQTGAQNVTSKKQTEGLQLWLEDVTKAGGIKLKDGTVLMPSLKFYDDESKTDRVQEIYTKLITDDEVDFLISPY